MEYLQTLNGITSKYLFSSSSNNPRTNSKGCPLCKAEPPHLVIHSNNMLISLITKPVLINKLILNHSYTHSLFKITKNPFRVLIWSRIFRVSHYLNSLAPPPSEGKILYPIFINSPHRETTPLFHRFNLRGRLNSQIRITMRRKCRLISKQLRPKILLGFNSFSSLNPKKRKNNQHKKLFFRIGLNMTTSIPRIYLAHA